MKQFALALLILIVLGSTALGVVDPFQKLLGPVHRVEYWSYEIKMKFGAPVEEQSGHTLTLYDLRGNDVQTIHYSRSGAVEERYERTFDEWGRVVQVEQYGWLGNLESRSVIAHAGNIQKWRTYNRKGDLISAYNNELDEDGNIIRIVIYDEETGAVSSTTDIVYTQNGEPSLTEMWDDDGDLMMKMENAYDTDGKDAVSEVILYLLGVEFLKTKSAVVLTERDTYGNWTKKCRYEFEEKFGEEELALTSIYRRRIEYD